MFSIALPIAGNASLSPRISRTGAAVVLASAASAPPGCGLCPIAAGRKHVAVVAGRELRSAAPWRPPGRLRCTRAHEPCVAGAMPKTRSPTRRPAVSQPADARPAASGTAAHLADQVIVGKAVLHPPVRDLVGVNRIGQDSRRFLC